MHSGKDLFGFYTSGLIETSFPFTFQTSKILCKIIGLLLCRGIRLINLFELYVVAGFVSALVILLPEMCSDLGILWKITIESLTTFRSYIIGF